MADDDMTAAVYPEFLFFESCLMKF